MKRAPPLVGTRPPGWQGVRVRAQASLACLLALLGCGKQPHGANQSPPGTHAALTAVSAPSSSAAPAPGACGDATGLRFLGSAWNGAPNHVRVNTPLALAAGAVQSAGAGCCVAWAAPDRTWTALDTFGQIAGTARVAKSEYYSVTECFELQLQSLSGTRGSDLWVSSAKPFQPAPSSEWKPQPAERAGLSALVKTLEAAMLPGPDWAGCDTKVAPLEQRVLFYRSKEGEQVHERAAIGGPLLIIAERDARRGGAWIGSFVDTSDATSCLPAQFSPKAVVDMDQDGVPEVVVHTDDGPIFGDIVYGFRQVGGWQVVARGIPGSTA